MKKKLKKNFLYVNPNADLTVKDGAFQRVSTYLKGLTSQGYNVTLVALPYGRCYFKNIRKRRSLKKELGCNLKIWPYYFSIESKKKNVLNQLLSFFIWFIVKVNGYHYVMSDSPIGVYLCRRVKGEAKLIANYRGDLIDEYKMNHFEDDNNDAIKNILLYLRKSVSLADFCIFCSDNLKENIESRVNSIIANYLVIPCCVDFKRFEHIKRSAHNKEQIVLGYFGGLSKWQKVDTVIQIAKRLHDIDSRYFLLILTNGDITPYQKLLHELNETNYEIQAVSTKDIPRWVEKMDVSFILRDDRPLNRVASPTKTYESLAAGVPVIVTKAAGDYKKITTSSICLELDNVTIDETKIEAINKFCLKITEKRYGVYSRCRDAVKEQSFDVYFNKLDLKLKELDYKENK